MPRTEGPHGRLRYRVGQFWALLSAPPLTAEAYQAIAAQLSPAEMALFERYGSGDQWHAWRVYQLLRGAGHTNPHLLRAALLHDVGKTRLSVTLVDRSIATLGKRFFPAHTYRWGVDRPHPRWQRPFVIAEQHPHWGAEMAAAAGAPPEVVRLIARHQETLTDPHTPEDHLLQQLHWADNQA